MKKLILVASLILLFPVISHAACQCDEDYAVEDEDGNYQEYSYFGLKSGTSHYMVPGVLGPAISYGAYSGHRYSRTVATEFAFDYLGIYKDAASSGHATAVSYAGVLHYDMTDDLSLIGKVGLAYTHIANPSLLGKNLVDITAGIGFDLRLSRNWNLRLEYDNFKIETPNKVNVTNAFVGLAYRY